MSIYTRCGDKGSSSLCDGNLRRKSDIRFEIVGTIDELICNLSLCRVYGDEKTNDIIIKIQKDLFRLSSELSKDMLSDIKMDVNWVEEIINNTNYEFKGFIIPGSNELSCRLHISRTICRRLERILSRIYNVSISSYINRLSDLLYVMGLQEETNIIYF